MNIPTGNELIRPFLPSRDFDTSKRFYEALGFTKLLDGDVAIFAIGGGGGNGGASSFVLQRYYHQGWAENCMMQLMVDDLDAWWQHLLSLHLAETFGVRGPLPPAMQPWGLRVAYLFDPSGVLWHVAQRRAGNPAD